MNISNAEVIILSDEEETNSSALEPRQPARVCSMFTIPRRPSLPIRMTFDSEDASSNLSSSNGRLENIINQRLHEEQKRIATSLKHLQIAYYSAGPHNRPFPLSIITQIENAQEQLQEEELAELSFKQELPILQFNSFNLRHCPECFMSTDNTESMGYSWRILGCGHVICNQCVAALLCPLLAISGDWHNLVKCPRCSAKLIQNYKLYIFRLN